jgi:alpha-glucosidase
VFPRPDSKSSPDSNALKFDYEESPFSFRISRRDSEEVLFDTSAASLIFESQYVRLRTKLPEDPYLYGLGEHTDDFRLSTTNYSRTLWNQDSYGVPEDSNLYGSQPLYLEHRESGSHGVFLLNSNGMDVMIDNNQEDGQFLEYNTLGGVLDFWFFAGPSPSEVTKQYAEVAGLPTFAPYWGLGFHQCRYGYQDAFAVAEVIYNYSQANIPLETMWTDIDYMDGRTIFTTDPERYPVGKLRSIVSYLHERNQHYIVMVDPAAGYKDYPTVTRGLEDNIFLLRSNGSVFLGVVWPGVTVFPDWFAENITTYWNNEFDLFFNPEDGIDIDGLWIDMNEPANIGCYFPW